MPLFQYKTITLHGKKQFSVIEAPTLHAAKERLRSQKILVTHLSLHKKRALFSLFSQEMSTKKLTLLTIQLAELTTATVPLYQSLLSLADQAEEEREQSILQSLVEQIKEGNSLSEAMKLYPQTFSPLYRSMIAAGERVGTLGKSLDKLAQLLIKRELLKKKLTTALLYPAVLALFSSLVIVIMLIFVIPSLETLLDQNHVNRFTYMVMGISHLITSKWHYLLALFSLVVTGGIYLFQKPFFRQKWHRCSLRLPILKTIIIKVSTARFMRTLASLLEGGVPLIEALALAKGVIPHPILQEDIMRAEKKIIEGSLLSHELSRSSWIPKLASRMVAIGEETGTLFHMLDKSAEMYEQEVEKTLTRLAELAQPIILVVMGAIVGLIMLAVLIPLTDATHLL